MNLSRLSLFVLMAVAPALAKAAAIPGVSSVPALDEWALIGLAIGVGSLGAWLVSHKK